MNLMRTLFSPVVPLLLGATLAFRPAAAADELVLFGTHRSGPGTGFSVGRFNPATGELTRTAFVCEAEAPSFFVVHPDGKHLYACNSIETFQGKPEGSISAYALDPASGRLTLLDRKPSGGGEPCYISLDRTGRYALAANYSGGSICVYALRPDGSLGERTAWVQQTGRSVNPERQTRAYAHCILTDPDNRFALAADLGADKIFVYHFNASNGSLTPNDPPSVPLKPGSGPRHITFHPNGRFVYVINEIAGTVTAFDWDSAKGTLAEFQTISTLPSNFDGQNTAAEVEVHPNGKCLYATNRGDDSIAVFAIDAKSGRLTRVGRVPTRGRMPRFFTLDPTGKWLLLLNHDSDNAIVFRVEEGTGLLTQTGTPVQVPNPFCARFLSPP